jgi:hypothetical protein
MLGAFFGGGGDQLTKQRVNKTKTKHFLPRVNKKQNIEINSPASRGDQEICELPLLSA